jgi:hypothetical protein
MTVLTRTNLNPFRGYLNPLKGYLASSTDIVIKFNIVLLVRSFRSTSIAISTLYRTADSILPTLLAVLRDT